MALTTLRLGVCLVISEPQPSQRQTVAVCALKSWILPIIWRFPGAVQPLPRLLSAALDTESGGICGRDVY
jgi:hypothetical protein